MRRLYRPIMAELLHEVVSGDLPSAGWLPGEQELAERFACSRSVVREAVRALEERRIVEVRSGQGQQMLGDDRWDLLDGDVAAAVLLGRRDPGLLRDALEAVRLVEMEAAMLAAVRARPGDLGLLAEALERMRSAAGGGNGAADVDDGFADADASFHRTLATIAGNRFLAAMLEPLPPLLALLRRRRAPDRDGAVLVLYDRILAALHARAAKDAARAVDDYGRHLASWLRA